MTPRWLIGILLGISSLLLVFTTLPPPEGKVEPRPIAFLRVDSRWADSVLTTLSVSQKIQQLIFWELEGSNSNASAANLYEALSTVTPGGIIWKGGYQDSLKAHIARAQQAARVPLLMVHRSGDTPSDLLQPGTALKMASLPDEKLLPDIGHVLASQAREIGFDMVMLPSMAAYYSPESYRLLADRAARLGQNLEEQHVLSCLEELSPYLPALGDSSREDSMLFPYRRLNSRGLSAWELGPRPDPAYRGFPPPISALTGRRLTFRGLVFAQVPDSLRDVEAALRGLIRSGSQYFQVSPQLAPEMEEALSSLIRTGDLLPETLDSWVYRLLLAKSWTRSTSAPVDSLDLMRERERTRFLYTHQASTLLRNPGKAFPIQVDTADRPHLLVIGQEAPTLLETMRHYTQLGYTLLQPDTKGELPAIAIRRLRYRDPIVVVLNGVSSSSLEQAAFQHSLQELTEGHRLAVINLGTPELAMSLPASVPLLQMHGADSLAQLIAAQAAWGGLAPMGTLPSSALADFPDGTHLSYLPTRLAYTPPQLAGVDPDQLAGIDTLIATAIAEHAMPGCQVVVARRGKVIWEKAYGYHTYGRRRRVKLTDVYDLASMTKVLATTLATMYMCDQKDLSLDAPLHSYFENTLARIDTSFETDTVWQVRYPTPTPDSLSDSLLLAMGNSWGGVAPLVAGDSLAIRPDSQWFLQRRVTGSALVRSPLFDLTLAELLTHHSGLPPNMPILPYLIYRKQGNPKYGSYFQPREGEEYPVKVAERFYGRRDIWDSIWEATKLLPIDPDKPYRYSDANLVLVQQVIDSLNGYGMDSLLAMALYEPLQLSRTGFLPREWAREREIVPTESDQAWRGQLLRGYVHDETAALLGGVSGNAGLFSNGSDLVHLLQMLLNEGTYGGQRLIRPGTIRTFTRRQVGHRGYGFDMRPFDGVYIGSPQASPRTYGHTGFTGTCFWVDPEEELIFIFLSNRVHPRRNNWYLSELQIRQRLHDLIYEALLPENSSLNP